jgi:IclR family KDG regulon transcriptional repressor
MSKKKRTFGVQAIERGCSALDLLGSGRQSYSLRDLSNELNLPKPTVHRILSTFCHLGYVMQEDISKEYRLGFRLVELGQVVLGGIQLRREAQPFLHNLSSQVQETVHLARLDGSEIVYLDKVEQMNDPKGLRMASRVGMRNYAHSCAMGKVLLAFLSDSERDLVFSQKGLPRLTKNTIVDRGRFEAHLVQVKAQGYSVDNEENEEGIKCVAAPVRNDRGEVVAAISISAPAVRMTKKRIDKEFKGEVIKTALEISKKLGFRDAKPKERR